MASRENEQKRSEWAERLTRHRASGLTVARFCAQERVSVNTFYYWSRRVGAGAASSAAQRAQVSTFPDVVSSGTRALGKRGPQPRTESATIGARNGEVRFLIDAAVEVTVPAECLDAIRCLVECLARHRVRRDAAFHEIVVAPR